MGNLDYLKDSHDEYMQNLMRSLRKKIRLGVCVTVFLLMVPHANAGWLRNVLWCLTNDPMHFLDPPEKRPAWFKPPWQEEKPSAPEASPPGSPRVIPGQSILSPGITAGSK